MKIHWTDLPNEILSIIINELAPSDTGNNDLEALAACRLVSHVLYSLATPVFFSSIQLTESGDSADDRIAAFEERAMELSQLLTNNDIATSVQSFTLTCDLINDGDSISSSTITEILRRLPHIQNFALGAEYPTCLMSFSSIAEDLASAIQALLTSPSLTRLDLYNISSFPRTLITAFSNLEYLRLQYIEFERFDYDNIDSNWSSVQGSFLKSLEIDECSLLSLGACIGDSHHMSFPEYFSQLKNLHFKNESMRLNYGWDFVLPTSQTLTTLEIYRDLELIVSAALFQDPPYDLGQLPALQHFRIQMPISFLDNRPMLCFLNQLFSISTSTTGIETVMIRITWSLARRRRGIVRRGHGKDMLSPDAGWSTLDETLASDKFVSLRHVVFALNLMLEESGDDDDYDHIWELEKNSTLPCIDALFPKFRASLNSQRTLEIGLDRIELN